MWQAKIQVQVQLHTVALRYQHDLSKRSAGGGAKVWPDNLEETANLSRPNLGKRDERLRRLEAILLLAREPLSSRRLSQYANLADATEARTLVRHLNEALDASGRAFRVEEVAGGFQLLTRPKFAAWLRKLAIVPKELRLSAPAMETLSVIAYRQPAARAEIEAIRGVNCGEILRQLLERDLVRIAGRSEELGRPYLYATTKRFLQLFGLRNLDDLPRAEQLRNLSSPKQNSLEEKNRPPNDSTKLQNTSAKLQTTSTKHQTISDSPDRNEEEIEVTATIRAELSPEELRKIRPGGIPGVLPRASDDEEEELDDAETDDDEDDFDDVEDDDEEDLEDDEDDEEDLDEVDDEEGFEEEEWEEVDDEDDEEDDEDDEDDEDWDDEEEEEEEEGGNSSWE